MKCVGCVLLVVIATLVPLVRAQTEMKDISAWKSPCDSFREQSCIGYRASRTVRIIEDRATRTKWLIEPNLEHPAGPGKIVAASHDGISVPSQIEQQRMRSTQTYPAAIIHPGDAVIVFEETSVSEARLEGVAVSMASYGEPVKVRLKIGGRSLDAVTVAPGRARLLPQPIEANQ